MKPDVSHNKEHKQQVILVIYFLSWFSAKKLFLAFLSCLPTVYYYFFFFKVKGPVAISCIAQCYFTLFYISDEKKRRELLGA